MTKREIELFELLVTAKTMLIMTIIISDKEEREKQAVDWACKLRGVKDTLLREGGEI